MCICWFSRVNKLSVLFISDRRLRGVDSDRRLRGGLDSGELWRFFGGKFVYLLVLMAWISRVNIFFFERSIGFRFRQEASRGT